MKTELMSITRQLRALAISMPDDPPRLKPPPPPIDEVLPADEMPAGQPTPSVLAWVECNKRSQIPAVAKGIRKWGRDCIVSTQPGKADILFKLRRMIPNSIKIIPGLKTMNILKDFGSAEQWARVGAEVMPLVHIIGAREFLFEHETAVKSIWKGTQEVDLGRLQLAIAAAGLPADVTYYWYPGAPGRSEETQKQYALLLRAVSRAIPNMVIVDNSSVNGPGAGNATNRRAGVISRGTGIPTIGMQYFYGPGSGWWQDDQMATALAVAKVKYDQVIIYTGIDRWPKVAGKLSKRLSKLGYGASVIAKGK